MLIEYREKTEFDLKTLAQDQIFFKVWGLEDWVIEKPHLPLKEAVGVPSDNAFYVFQAQRKDFVLRTKIMGYQPDESSYTEITVGDVLYLRGSAKKIAELEVPSSFIYRSLGLIRFFRRLQGH